MSMTLVTALQMLEILLVYTATLWALPNLVWRRRLLRMGLVDRFVFCCVAGNFWIMNAVLALMTFKIGSRLTLFLGTYGVGLVCWGVRERAKLRATARHHGQLLLWLLRGELRGMLYVRRVMAGAAGNFRRALHRVWLAVLPHGVEWLFLLIATGFNLWYFSYQTFTYYSYGTSDMAVHAYWINAMAEGRLFKAGVYPYGFHCLIHYLSTVFDMDTFHILRVFGPVQSVLIFLMFYALARKLCRSRSAPLLAYIVYSMTAAFTSNTMMRFQWPIPQEHGMLYIYPVVYYLLTYLKQRDGEVLAGRPVANAAGGRVWPESMLPLILFGAAVAQTLTVHFYDTMFAGLFCVAVFVAFLPRILRPRVLGPIILAGLLGLIVAIAPMGLAYLRGTPLEGSFGWGASVISKSVNAQDAEEDEGAAVEEVKEKTPLMQTVRKKILGLPKAVKEYCYYLTRNRWYSIFVGLLLTTAAGAVLGALFVRRNHYARGWLAVVGYVCILMVMALPKYFGIPTIVDDSRMVIFQAYAMGLLYAYPLDAVYVFIAWRKRSRKIWERLVYMACLCLTLLVRVAGLQKDWSFARSMNTFYHLQYSANITVLYDLIYRYPTHQWTYISTITETRQVYQHGWHYELSDFIMNQQNWKPGKRLTIPTKYLFIILEKKVLSYAETVQLANDEPSYVDTSAELAAQPLTKRNASSAYYYGEKRPILMSKLYYWIEAFKKLYPNEFEVYYEDEFTICYKLVQNEYFLYNLAIDYGFNRAAEGGA